MELDEIQCGGSFITWFNIYATSYLRKLTERVMLRGQLVFSITIASQWHQPKNLTELASQYTDSLFTASKSITLVKHSKYPPLLRGKDC